MSNSHISNVNLVEWQRNNNQAHPRDQTNTRIEQYAALQSHEYCWESDRTHLRDVELPFHWRRFANERLLHEWVDYTAYENDERILILPQQDIYIHGQMSSRASPADRLIFPIWVEVDIKRNTIRGQIAIWHPYEDILMCCGREWTAFTWFAAWCVLQMDVHIFLWHFPSDSEREFSRGL
jgi:hypothetical protein